MSSQNDASHTDPQLDALLGHVLGRRRLSDEQRQRHYARLGIAPTARRSMTTTSTMTALPFDIGRSSSFTFGEPEPGARRRSRQWQWLELGTAALAVLLVGALLIGLFDSGSGDDDETGRGRMVVPSSVGVSPTEHVRASPAPAPRFVTQERLYTVGLVYPVTIGATIGTIGRVTAYDAETGRMLYNIDRGGQIDAALSPDGSRLYVAALNQDGTGDELWELDAATGTIRWAIPLEGRVTDDAGDGPSSLAVSRDGSRVFVHSMGEPWDHYIDIFDTATGFRISQVRDLTPCDAQLQPSSDGRSLYVVCLGRQPPQVIDLTTLERVESIESVIGYKVGSVLSPDGRELYILADTDGLYQITVVDTTERDIVGGRQIAHIGGDELRSLQLLALSADGSLLFVGLGSENPDGRPYASAVWVWETDTWESSTQLPVSATINGPSLAPSPDGRSVFAISNLFYERTNEPGRADILKVGLDDSAEWFVRKNSEKVIRLLTGKAQAVTSSTPDLAEEFAMLNPPQSCPVTSIAKELPPDASQATFTDTWYGGDDLWAGLGRENERTWTEGANRVLWWRKAADPLTVTGFRLDGEARPVIAEVFDGYDGMQHQISTLTFPSPGCWEVRGIAGEQQMTFVVEAVPHDEMPGAATKQP